MHNKITWYRISIQSILEGMPKKEVLEFLYSALPPTTQPASPSGTEIEECECQLFLAKKLVIGIAAPEPLFFLAKVLVFLSGLLNCDDTLGLLKKGERVEFFAKLSGRDGESSALFSF